MTHFTSQNSDGWTDQQIALLNAVFDRCVNAGLVSPDEYGNYDHSGISHLAEKIQNKFYDDTDTEQELFDRVAAEYK
jgi:hypothetical protein